ncbi:hypothetical protein GCM10023082_04060 [Streptomyces tremellae]|uniref:Uncharacterized protein n=1 Tax=Streptomyces tremellae TaxID=1124239 RepID=A0ABP7DRH3_9ACTN
MSGISTPRGGVARGDRPGACFALSVITNVPQKGGEVNFPEGCGGRAATAVRAAGQRRFREITSTSGVPYAVRPKRVTVTGRARRRSGVV